MVGNAQMVGANAHLGIDPERHFHDRHAHGMHIHQQKCCKKSFKPFCR